MAGYLNRFIDLGFPELAGVDDAGRAVVWVKIRNPRLIPGEDLLSPAAASKIRIDPETGKPIEADVNAAETFGSFARLIIAGNVWDAKWIPTNFDDDTEEPPLLGMPPTADEVGRMPIEILNAIGEELKKANPR